MTENKLRPMSNLCRRGEDWGVILISSCGFENETVLHALIACPALPCCAVLLFNLKGLLICRPKKGIRARASLELKNSKRGPRREFNGLGVGDGPMVMGSLEIKSQSVFLFF